MTGRGDAFRCQLSRKGCRIVAVKYLFWWGLAFKGWVGTGGARICGEGSKVVPVTSYTVYTLLLLPPNCLVIWEKVKKRCHDATVEYSSTTLNTLLY